MQRTRFIILLIFLGCNSSTNKQTIISSLELTLDSLTVNSTKINAGFEIADSLLIYEPTNARALSIKALKFFNDRKPAQAIPLFKNALKNSNGLDKDYIDSNFLCLAWSYEQIRETDSAKKYYELTLNRIDSTWQMNIGKPQLTTILYGKVAGLKSLEKFNYGKSYFREQIKNDIELYSGDGLSEFVPSFFGGNQLIRFQITIPDSMYNNDTLNSTPKVLLMFAELGINIRITEINVPNKTYKFYITEKYFDRLNELDTLNLKRL